MAARRRRCTRLVRNYRSHENILRLPSRLFYHNQLVACASGPATSLPASLIDQERANDVDDGDDGDSGGNGGVVGGRVARLLFYGVKGRQAREGRGEAPSYFNAVEAQALVELLAGWLARGGDAGRWAGAPATAYGWRTLA
jgi:putative helicase MOV10L1